MQQYLYRPAGANGVRGAAIEIDALDDCDAVQMIRLGLESADVELWRGNRKVAIVPNSGPPMWL